MPCVCVCSHWFSGLQVVYVGCQCATITTAAKWITAAVTKQFSRDKQTPTSPCEDSCSHCQATPRGDFASLALSIYTLSTIHWLLVLLQICSSPRKSDLDTCFFSNYKPVSKLQVWRKWSHNTITNEHGGMKGEYYRQTVQIIPIIIFGAAHHYYYSNYFILFLFCENWCSFLHIQVHNDHSVLLFTLSKWLPTNISVNNVCTLWLYMVILQ